MPTTTSNEELLYCDLIKQIDARPRGKRAAYGDPLQLYTNVYSLMDRLESADLAYRLKWHGLAALARVQPDLAVSCHRRMSRMEVRID